MSAATEQHTVRVPDIGEFENVEVAQWLVQPGARVTVEQALVVIESDKASMELPSPVAGKVLRLCVGEGDVIQEGSELCVIEGVAVTAAATEKTTTPAPEKKQAQEKSATPAAATSVTPVTKKGPLLVLGGGPGGYTAAFRAADLGLEVILVERYPRLGGVCLNVGCIPSKALLHMAGVLEEARALGAHGIAFGEAQFAWEKIRARKNQVVGTLTNGLAGLARARKVRVVTGVGRFTSANEIEVRATDGDGDGGDAGNTERITFAQAILATGSRPSTLPGWPDDPRILNSTTALEVDGPPAHLLVVGGGIIGLEMATVYLAFGWRVTIVEMLSRLVPGADADLVKPLEKKLRAACAGVYLETAVRELDASGAQLVAHFESVGENARANKTPAPASAHFDRVLLAVGRRPNADGIGLEALGVRTDDGGFVPVDAQLRTNVPHVFAIGDLSGAPLLAHRAAHQGKVAAEVAAGKRSRFHARAIPGVAYTDPEIAWAGVTEDEARAQGIEFEKALFPWSASGRALGIGRSEGLTKLLFAKDGGRLLGAGIVGPHAGELIAEPTLGIELGANAEDLGLTIHAHPTLSETIGLAAEVATGTITDLPPKRRR